MSATVVIDMQAGFGLSAQFCLPEVIKLVERAKHKNHHIILVELHSSTNGPTFPQILKPLENYDKIIAVEKYSEAGGLDIEKTLKRLRLNFKRFRVCGVNTQYCVRATAKELAGIYSKSKIILHKEACFGPGDDNNNSDLTTPSWNWIKYAPENMAVFFKGTTIHKGRY